MAAENLIKSKLKTNTSARKSILTLVTLPSFSISGEISAEKMYVEIENFTDVCMTGGIYYTHSHTPSVNVTIFNLNFFSNLQFSTYIFSLVLKGPPCLNKADLT